MKIAVIGIGYVGLSLATLMAKKHQVIAVDIVEDKIKLVNARISPIADKDIQDCFNKSSLNLHATTDMSECVGADFIIIATPTDYNPETHYFNTSSVEGVAIKIASMSPESLIIIKSTVPIGYTRYLYEYLNIKNIIFSPEFLREGKALYDNLHPSRIIAGVPDKSLIEKANCFVNLLSDCAMDCNVMCSVIGSTEAESVKLFSNTYLAMRVAFFNELDTFAICNHLKTREIIDGVCLDPRIGDYYNNPSFGYGGYCLPKDTQQLVANYQGVPNSLMGAIVDSNLIRKKFIVDQIYEALPRKRGIIGIYRLVMKTGSDNFRESAIIDIMQELSNRGLDILIYEPTIKSQFHNWSVESDFSDFCNKSMLIVVNRYSPELSPYQDKLFCRDVFNRD